MAKNLLTVRRARHGAFYRDSCIGAILAIFLVHGASATEGNAVPGFKSWDARMAQRFERMPKLKTMRGGGWKPYNRLKWFYETRMPNGEEIPPRARWEAAKRMRLKWPRSATEPSWSSLGPANIAGRILAIEFHPMDPHTVLAGSASGGLWKSADDGVSWMPLTDNLPSLAVGAVLVPSSSPNVIIIGTGEPTIAYDAIGGVGILRSEDRGQTWSETNIVSDPKTVKGGYRALEENPSTGIILAAGWNGLLRSTDAGSTWSYVEAEGNWTDVKWRPGSSDTAYAACEYRGIFVSRDGGLTFTPTMQGLPPGNDMGGIIQLAVSPSVPDVLYAGISRAETYDQLGIYRSTDGGATWKLRLGDLLNIYGFQGYYNNTLIVDPHDPNRVFAGGIGLWRSADGGVSWQPIGTNVHADHHAIAYRASGENDLWVGTDGGVYESLDGGDTWLERNSGLVTLQLYDACGSAHDPSMVWGGSQDNGLLRRIGDQSWLFGPPGDGMVCNCDSRDSGHVYGELQFGDHLVSHDGMETWQTIDDGLHGNARFVTPVELDPSNGNRIFTATDAGVFRSVNGGAFWNLVDPIPRWTVSIGVSPISSRYVWALDRATGSVRVSHDGGDTWSPTSSFSFRATGAIEVVPDPLDSLAALVTFAFSTGRSQLIVRTADGGLTWQDVTGDLRETSVNALVIDPRCSTCWYVGTDLGVWSSRNGGENWEPFGSGLPNAVVLDLEIQRSATKLRAATHGRGLWEVDLAQTTSLPGTELSRRFYLEQPSPNPTREFAWIRYVVSSGEAQLIVRDIQGRQVARLGSRVGDGLMRSVVWDSRGVAVGVYLVELRTRQGITARKVVVVR